jgi:hypothetical protein
VVEEGGLAGARPSADHEAATATGTRAGEEGVDYRQFARTPEQNRPAGHGQMLSTVHIGWKEVTPFLSEN